MTFPEQLQLALTHAGSPKNLATLIEVQPRTIQTWIKTNKPPSSLNEQKLEKFLSHKKTLEIIQKIEDNNLLDELRALLPYISDLSSDMEYTKLVLSTR